MGLTMQQPMHLAMGHRMTLKGSSYGSSHDPSWVLVENLNLKLNLKPNRNLKRNLNQRAVLTVSGRRRLTAPQLHNKAAAFASLSCLRKTLKTTRCQLPTNSGWLGNYRPRARLGLT